VIKTVTKKNRMIVLTKKTMSRHLPIVIDAVIQQVIFLTNEIKRLKRKK
jgi:hypothetical protein